MCSLSNDFSVLMAGVHCICVGKEQKKEHQRLVCGPAFEDAILISLTCLFGERAEKGGGKHRTAVFVFGVSTSFGRFGVTWRRK